MKKEDLIVPYVKELANNSSELVGTRHKLSVQKVFSGHHHLILTAS